MNKIIINYIKLLKLNIKCQIKSIYFPYLPKPKTPYFF